VFGRQKQTDFSTDGTARARGWPRSERARRRDRERADAELINELRWQWRSACTGTSLAQMIYTPSGPTRAVPMIESVHLGPPVSLLIRLRPGQTLDEFKAAAPALAPTLDVAELQMIPVPPYWVRIVLLPAPVVALPSRLTRPVVEALPFGA
jgi:hypothetical protein